MEDILGGGVVCARVGQRSQGDMPRGNAAVKRVCGGGLRLPGSKCSALICVPTGRHVPFAAPFKGATRWTVPLVRQESERVHA